MFKMSFTPKSRVNTAIALAASCMLSGPAAAEAFKPADAVATFKQSLGRELKSAIQAKGPASAVDVCHVRAPEIAAQLSKDMGVTVRRISERTRNPDATPDALDKRVLADFATAIKQDATAKPTRTVESAGGRSRYYSAIRIQPLCLTCHGSDLAPDVAARLKAFYPDDRATGYELGELRGAFVVEF